MEKILFKVREKSGSFVSGQGISKSLYKVREFYLKVTANYFITSRYFCIETTTLYETLSKPSLFWLIHGQKIIIITVREKTGIVFVPVGGNHELPDHFCHAEESRQFVIVFTYM